MHENRTIPLATVPITLGRPSTVSEEDYIKYKQSYEDLLKPFNERIKNGGKVSMKEVYDLIGYPYRKDDEYEMELIETWGWDSKGFRQLYVIKKTVTIEKVPV